MCVVNSGYYPSVNGWLWEWFDLFDSSEWLCCCGICYFLLCFNDLIEFNWGCACSDCDECLILIECYVCDILLISGIVYQ